MRDLVTMILNEASNLYISSHTNLIPHLPIKPLSSPAQAYSNAPHKSTVSAA